MVLHVCVSQWVDPDTQTETQTWQSSTTLKQPGQLRETILPRWHRRNTPLRNTAPYHSCWCQLTNKAPCRLSSPLGSRWQGENNGQLSRDNVFHGREKKKKPCWGRGQGRPQQRPPAPPAPFIPIKLSCIQRTWEIMIHESLLAQKGRVRGGGVTLFVSMLNWT